MRRFLFTAIVLATALPVSSQNSVLYDLTTIEGTIEALYQSISGPEGFEIDRETFDPLFVENARLSATYFNQEGDQAVVSWTATEYVETIWNGARERGFFEIETARTVEQFAQIAHVFSTYESRWNEDDEEPFQRGINSIQLLNKDGRWWIVNIFWEGESEDNPIPAQYLPQG
ncbi:MAG: hypothetical protein IIC18_10195 [Bacteroidetes bacterium]|nr:hypothetical protein [Bacteroidota bacterium]